MMSNLYHGVMWFMTECVFTSMSIRLGGPIESCIRGLYGMAETCDYEDKKEEHNRDRVEIGILDESCQRHCKISGIEPFMQQ